MSEDLSSQVQAEVARIRCTIQSTMELLPDANVNFGPYYAIISKAEEAVREQDAAALVQILPVLREME